MPKIIINLNGEDVEIPLPYGLKLRKQNPECNKNGKICTTYGKNNQLVCWKVEVNKTDSGIELGEVGVCERNPNKNIKIEV